MRQVWLVVAVAEAAEEEGDGALQGVFECGGVPGGRAVAAYPDRGPAESHAGHANEWELHHDERPRPLDPAGEDGTTYHYEVRVVPFVLHPDQFLERAGG